MYTCIVIVNATCNFNFHMMKSREFSSLVTSSSSSPTLFLRISTSLDFRKISWNGTILRSEPADFLRDGFDAKHTTSTSCEESDAVRAT